MGFAFYPARSVGFRVTGWARLFYDLKTLLLYADGHLPGLSSAGEEKGNLDVLPYLITTPLNFSMSAGVTSGRR